MMNHLINFIQILFLLLFILKEIDCQVQLFYEPEAREQHSAVILNRKLYISGGNYVNDQGPTKGLRKEFFYYDISVSSDISGKIGWQEPINILGDIPPPHYGAAAVTGGVNNNELFLFGGIIKNTLAGTPTPLIYVFNEQEKSWRIPNITGVEPPRRSNIQAVIDTNGKMYLFGGSDLRTTFNSMDILDTINLSWNKGSDIGAPSPRTLYSATLLADANILYIGGQTDPSSGIYVPLSSVNLYNTVDDNWRTVTTGGIKLGGRASHTAVLGMDKTKVIVYSGEKELFDDPVIVVLNLADYSWSASLESGKIPIFRKGHTAIVDGNYMLVTFGFTANLDADGTLEPDQENLFILDIKNDQGYAWVTSYVPPPDAKSPLPPLSTPKNPKVPKTPPTEVTTTPKEPTTTSETTTTNDDDDNNTGTIITSVLGTCLGAIIIISGDSLCLDILKKKSAVKKYIRKEIPHNEYVIPVDEELEGYNRKDILQIPADRSVEYNNNDILQIPADRSIEYNNNDVLQIPSDRSIENNNNNFYNNQEILQIASDRNHN